MFFAYAVLGVIKLALALSLSKKCEIGKNPVPQGDSECALLLADDDGATDPPPKISKSSLLSLFPKISTESRRLFVNLAILFALDSFASGLAPL